MSATSHGPRAARRPLGAVAAVFGPIQAIGAPIVDLLFRVLIFRAFFNAGMTKINDWENTLFLFEYEYAVPILPPDVTAYLATSFELGMSSLILVGLLTRLAVLPLFAMALTIQFVLGAANPAYSNIEHFYWMTILLMLFVRGAGPLSLDHLLARRLGLR